MTTEKGLRYAAHHALPGIGRDGQARIKHSSIALVGLGGLGCATAQYLVSSGIGRLTLCDFDRVEESNLARQILYTPSDVGSGKAEAARETLNRLNPECQLELVASRVDRDRAAQLAEDHEICIDASDNYGTRLAMNAAQLAAGKPWVMGSCIRQEGQLILFQPELDQACYRCVYGSAPEQLEDCPGAGIFAPVAGIIGASMAHLALQYLAGQQVDTSLKLLDASVWEWRHLVIRRQPDCPACAASFDD